MSIKKELLFCPLGGVGEIGANMSLYGYGEKNFYDWIKGAELVELETCNTKEDPIRPELDVKFRTSHGRKIFGVKYKKEICAIMCFGFTNEIPKTIEEFDLMTKDAHLQSASWRNDNVGKIAIAYTVWSKKKGGGKLIVKEAFKKIKKSNHLNRFCLLYTSGRCRRRG